MSDVLNPVAEERMRASQGDVASKLERPGLLRSLVRSPSVMSSVVWKSPFWNHWVRREYWRGLSVHFSHIRSDTWFIDTQ